MLLLATAPRDVPELLEGWRVMAGADDGAPQDPMTMAAEACSSVHELFTSYVAVGFTQAQALYLVGVHVRVWSQTAPGEGD